MKLEVQKMTSGLAWISFYSYHDVPGQGVHQTKDCGESLTSYDSNQYFIIDPALLIQQDMKDAETSIFKIYTLNLANLQLWGVNKKQ